MRIFALLLLLTITGIALGAQTLDISPEADGTINVKGNFEWAYNAEMQGWARLWTKNTTSYEDASPGTGLEQSLTTIQKQISAELVPAAWTLEFASLGLALKSDLLDIRETGFLDFRESDILTDPVIRLFFHNYRLIYTLKPALSATLKGGTQEFNWTLRGTYSPWIHIGLTQDLSSAAAGYPTYNTPRTKGVFNNSSFHSWSVNLKSGLELSGLAVDFENQWEGNLYDYISLSVGGGTQSIKALIVDGIFDLNFALSDIKVQSWIPRIGVGLDWSGTWNQAPGSTPDYSTKWRINLGFKGANGKGE